MLNEAETRAEHIDPALKAAGWGVVDGSRVRREHICPGRIEVGGRRATTADFDTAGTDVLTSYSAAIDDTPARSFQRGVNVFGSGLGFVEHRLAELRRVQIQPAEQA